MWDEIYLRHYKELLKYCTAACQDEGLAEDIVQETFLKALQNADVFEDLGTSQRRAWLYRTMKNLICDRYRRAMLESQYVQTVQEQPYYLDSGIMQLENEMLLQSLQPEDRIIFTLRYMEGRNASEISQMLGIPAGTIRARLSRCRNLLKNMMET